MQDFFLSYGPHWHLVVCGISALPNTINLSAQLLVSLHLFFLYVWECHSQYRHEHPSHFASRKIRTCFACLPLTQLSPFREIRCHLYCVRCKVCHFCWPSSSSFTHLVSTDFEFQCFLLSDYIHKCHFMSCLLSSSYLSHIFKEKVNNTQIFKVTMLQLILKNACVLKTPLVQ